MSFVVILLLLHVDAGASPVETGSIRTEEDGVSGCMTLEM